VKMSRMDEGAEPQLRGGVGGANATIGLRILTESFALEHGTSLSHPRWATRG
jgi:hypothetical protein